VIEKKPAVEPTPATPKPTEPTRAQQLAATEVENYARANADHRAPGVEQKEG
jgi:hypothetical protein